MELRTKFTKGTETCESLEPAGFLASPQPTGKGLPLKKAAARVDTREVECPQQLPSGQKAGTCSQILAQNKSSTFCREK